MIQTINQHLEKAMPFITPSSVVLGLVLSNYIQSWVAFVPWVFAFITLASSIGVRIEKIKTAITDPKPIFLSLGIIQLLMPCIAFLLGHLFFPNDYLTVVGLIIAFIIPTGVISLMWVSIYKGNSSVSLLIVLVNTLLAPFVIPFSLHLFVGASIDINTWSLMSNLFLMIVIPSLLGIALNYIPALKTKDVKGTLAPFSKFGLFFVIAVNSSVAAPVLGFNWKLISIAIIVFCIASLGYLLGVVLGKLLKFENDVIISLLFNSGMRNISVGATIAILYFPAPVSVPIVLGTLFQQTLAAFYGRILSNYLQKKEQNQKQYKLVN
jgi:predicted Na+-dependent transporter